MIELNRIYNEDCLQGMTRIPDARVDLVVSDPPYLIAYKTGVRKNKTHRFCHEIIGDRDNALVQDYLKQCYRVLKDNSAAYIFCSAKTLHLFREYAQDAGFKVKNTIIWVKNSSTRGDLKAQYGQRYEPLLYLNKGRCPINGKRLSDVWEFPRVAAQHLLHQNQKPIPLIEQCINKSSQSGGVILDGFMGSGTTAVACINTGRNFIGFELDKGYYDISQKRLKSVELNLGI